MVNQSYEVEIKCLLGSKEKVEKLLERMQLRDPKLQQLSFHKQLNHYFIGRNLKQLYENVTPFLREEEKGQFQLLASEAKDFSLRTRLADGEVILVLKISVDEGTSFNTVGRREFEVKIPNLTLEELDQLVLKSGFEYQAKWSRERTEFAFKDINITIDENAGYGYLAEFEKVVEDEIKVPQAKADLKKLMEELGVHELPQDRLERMFAFYNAHWPDYYGTDKVFVVE